jgi:hypothetical protein
MKMSKIKQMQQTVETFNLLEQDMKDDQLWGTRDGSVTAEQLVKYAQEHPHILEMALRVAEQMENSK